MRQLVALFLISLLAACAAPKYTVDDGRKVDEVLLGNIRSYGSGERAMRTALVVAAIPMMSMYIKAAAPQLDRLERDAAAAKRAIQRLNLRPVRVTCDRALVGMSSFDPRTWRTL